MHIPAVAIALLFTALVLPASAQSGREPRRVGLDEHAQLQHLVDNAATGNPAGGNAFLRWTPHFLRGADRRTYIPFTLRVEEAPGSFRSAAMYIRVAPRGDEGRDARKAEGVQNILGVASGEMPVSNPDRRQGTGAPTAAEASIMLRSLTATKDGVGYPYEAAYAVETVDAGGNASEIRRAIALAPGEYDLYIALLERGRRGDRKWAVMKQQITVPDLAAEGLRLSSIIVADRVDALPAPLPAAEQLLRPYALGAAELVPARDDELRQDETLHIAFLIYDAAVDGAGMPDVRVEYRLYQENFASDRLLGATAPQVFDSSTLPRGFDLRTGQQLAAMQFLPLSSYEPGSYRLAVRVIDNRSGAVAEEHVRFVITS